MDVHLVAHLLLAPLLACPPTELTNAQKVSSFGQRTLSALTAGVSVGEEPSRRGERVKWDGTHFSLSSSYTTLFVRLPPFPLDFADQSQFDPSLSSESPLTFSLTMSDVEVEDDPCAGSPTTNLGLRIGAIFIILVSKTWQSAERRSWRQELIHRLPPPCRISSALQHNNKQVTSLFGTLFPIASKRIPFLRRAVPGVVFEFAK